MATPHRKVSLHFGINLFDVDYYGPGNDLRGCENDAHYMMSIAQKKGFETNLYLSDKATYAVYADYMTRMANELVDGDIFLFTDSSHGTYQDIPNQKRETAICLHDRIVWDFETKQFLMKFKKGVTVVWMTDSCFSQDNFKELQQTSGGPKVRFLDFGSLLKAVAPVPIIVLDSQITCNIIAFTSSSDQQPSFDMESFVDRRPMGLYTASLEKVFTNDPNNLNLTYYYVGKNIANVMHHTGMSQTPNIQQVNGYRDRIIHKVFLT